MTGTPLGEPGDPRLRFRIWVDGNLAEECWFDSATASHQDFVDVSRWHVSVTSRAADEGKVWLVEIYDPEQPEDQAYTRFGTDTAGMVQPTPVADGELTAAILGDYPGGGDEEDWGDLRRVVDVPLPGLGDDQ